MNPFRNPIIALLVVAGLASFALASLEPGNVIKLTLLHGINPSESEKPVPAERSSSPPEWSLTASLTPRSRPHFNLPEGAAPIADAQHLPVQPEKSSPPAQRRPIDD